MDIYTTIPQDTFSHFTGLRYIFPDREESIAINYTIGQSIVSFFDQTTNIVYLALLPFYAVIFSTLYAYRHKKTNVSVVSNLLIITLLINFLLIFIVPYLLFGLLGIAVGVVIVAVFIVKGFVTDTSLEATAKIKEINSKIEDISLNEKSLQKRRVKLEAYVALREIYQRRQDKNSGKKPYLSILSLLLYFKLALLSDKRTIKPLEEETTQAIDILALAR